MAILVHDSNKAACRAAEAALQQTGRAALVRPAGTGKGSIAWELLEQHPAARVLWVVSCAARMELRRRLAKRLGRELDERVRLVSCEQLAVESALGWVALAEFRPDLLLLDGWREMSAKDWTGSIEPLLRLCPKAKLLALAEPDTPGDSCRTAEELLGSAVVEPLALGVWLGAQRAAYKEGTLTEAQIAKLEALQVDWTNRNDRKWQTAYEAAVRYYNAHGNIDVPTEYIDEDGVLLGKWVSRQRYAWQNPDRSSARVTPERKALLDELGMNWEKADSWQHRYELAMEYKKEHGSLAVPAQYRTEDGVWLGSWLSRQKQTLRENKKLSAERRAALKELFKGEKDRRSSGPVQPACSVREQNWLDNYQSAKRYAAKKGDLLVPAGYVDENGFRLGVWISNLRAARKTRPDSFQVTPEHIAMLDAIGMQWDAREAKWAGALRRAEEYRAAHGDLLVPVNYKTEDGFCLGDWIRRMRESYASAERKLNDARIQKLNELGMVWTLPEG